MSDDAARAVALRYADDLPAPVVLATGRGALAAVIERIAREHQIHVAVAGDLAEALVELDPGTLIPPEYYSLVAELLVFVYGLGDGDDQ